MPEGGENTESNITPVEGAEASNTVRNSIPEGNTATVTNGTTTKTNVEDDSAYVKQLRAESAARGKQLKELQAKLTQFEEAQLTEQQKLSKRVEELAIENEKLNRAHRISKIEVAASRLGAIHADAIAKLVDDDVEDIDKAVEETKKRYPQLFRPTVGADAAAGNNGDNSIPGVSMNDWIRGASTGTGGRR